MDLTEILNAIPEAQTYIGLGTGLILGAISRLTQGKKTYSTAESETSHYFMGFTGAVVAGFSVAVSQDASLAEHLVDQASTLFGYHLTYFTAHLTRK